jgi:hypothetical protein
LDISLQSPNPSTPGGFSNLGGQLTDGSPQSTISQIQQQQIDASPISTQLNKVLKKTKKDTEKKMLLNEEDFQ